MVNFRTPTPIGIFNMRGAVSEHPSQIFGISGGMKADSHRSGIKA